MLEEWVLPQYLNRKKQNDLNEKFHRSPPFPHLVLPNFFHPEKAEALLTALSNESFERKKADLFQLSQTPDFQISSQPLLREFRVFLASPEFIQFMSSITGKKLNVGTIDISGSLYEDGDFLLCHDDRVEGRKIAFFLYLSDLDKRDGGVLSLFESTRGMPTCVGQTITPQFNTFAFFLVSPKSFHQVDEIITNTQRIAISGWFHGD